MPSALGGGELGLRTGRAPSRAIRIETRLGPTLRIERRENRPNVDVTRTPFRRVAGTLAPVSVTARLETGRGGG